MKEMQYIGRRLKPNQGNEKDEKVYRGINLELKQDKDKEPEKKEQRQKGGPPLLLMSQGFITLCAITAAGDRL